MFASMPLLYYYLQIISKINIMGLRKYIVCDQNHEKDYEYCCLKDKKIFCARCWFSKEHFRVCQSTRCGSYQKIAHLVLNRAFQFKNAQYLEGMASNVDKYQDYRKKFIQLNYNMTETLKEFVEQKAPLFIWGMMNEMLLSRSSKEEPSHANKYDGVCVEMLRVMKSADRSKKSEYLQTVIGSFYQIDHELDGNINRFKESTTWLNNNPKDNKIHEVLEHCKKEIGRFFTNTKNAIRTGIQTQISKIMTSFDQKLATYKGVVFSKVQSEMGNFRKREGYTQINFLSQSFRKINNEKTDLYNGFHLNIFQLQECPEQLLATSKCMLKQKLFDFYQSLSIPYKLLFPYKYAYVISTTISPDEELQAMILNLQMKAMSAQSGDQKAVNPAFNSINIVIIGKEVIVIRFYNHPTFSYSMKIYGYTKARSKYYDQVIQILNLGKVQRKKINEQCIEYTEAMNQTSLVYCNFRIAYESIFLYSGEQLIFEGEKTCAARGAEQFNNLVQKWKMYAQIDLKFSLPFKEIVKMML